MDNLQEQLKALTEKNDNRTSIFDLEIVKFNEKSLALSGRILKESQLDEIRRVFSKLDVDTASIKILERPNLPRMRVSTNITGLYERPTFGMPLSSELYYGTELEILEEKERWAFTRQKDGYLGWAHKPYLTSDVLPTETHIVTAPSVEARFDSNFNSEIVTRLVSGTGVIVKETRSKWSNVQGNKSGWIPSSTLRAIDDIPRSTESRRNAILEDSAKMIGVPYLWGGTSGNGIDCSGFARLLHRWIGIEIPRDADMQHKAAKPVQAPYEIGDLFFFSEGDDQRHVTHVGISLGGWNMIHSSRSRNGVYIDNIEEREGLKSIFTSAGSFLR